MLLLIFGGKTSAALQHLLVETDVDKDELKEIRKLIEEYEEKSSQHKAGK